MAPRSNPSSPLTISTHYRALALSLSFWKCALLWSRASLHVYHARFITAYYWSDTCITWHLLCVCVCNSFTMKMCPAISSCEHLKDLPEENIWPSRDIFQCRATTETCHNIFILTPPCCCHGCCVTDQLAETSGVSNLSCMGVQEFIQHFTTSSICFCVCLLLLQVILMLLCGCLAFPDLTATNLQIWELMDTSALREPGEPAGPLCSMARLHD